MSTKKSGPAGSVRRKRKTKTRTGSGRPTRRALVRWGAGLLLAAGFGYLAATVVPDPLRPSADATVRGVPAATVRIGAYRGRGGGIEIAPADGEAAVLLILYPGGLVRPHAYAWLGVALAPVGIRTLIPTMPLDLAVLGRDRAGSLARSMRNGERGVVLAGHSLGGTMAAWYAARNPGTIDGLILMGAYPPPGVDLAGQDLPTLLLAAEFDGLATLEEVREGRARLPEGTGLEVIGGAVHSFFGRYGPQRGDGLPTVPRSVAEAEIAGSVEAFLASLR